MIECVCVCVCVCGGGGGGGGGGGYLVPDSSPAILHTVVNKSWEAVVRSVRWLYVLAVITHRTCHKEVLSQVREGDSIDAAMVATDVCCVHVAGSVHPVSHVLGPVQQGASHTRLILL